MTLEEALTRINVLERELATLRHQHAPEVAEAAASAVCRVMRVPTDSLRKPIRVAEVVRARCVVAWYLRERMMLPMREVARMLGRRDHTSVIHWVSRVDMEDELTKAAIAAADFATGLT